MLVKIRGGESAGAPAEAVQGEAFTDPALAEKFPGKKTAKFVSAVGTYLLPTDVSGDVIANAIKSGKVFEQEIVDVAKRFIVPGTTVLDVGSNFGQMAVEFSRLAGPEGSVHCFEANDFVFEILVRNLELNGATRAIPHRCAVWSESGKELLFPDPDFERFASYGSYGLDLKAKQGKQVITQAIDDLNISGKVSFIKVDIQGSDLFAMQGAKRLILRDKPVLIFEFEAQFQKEFGTSFKDYKQFIEEIDYEVMETVNRINFVIGPKKT